MIYRSLYTVSLQEFPFENGIKFALYDCDDIIERCNRIREAVNREIDIAKIRKQFMEEVHAGIDKHQKEYVLREQMRVIREELGEEGEGEIEEFLERTKRLNASDEIKQKINKEIGRYRSMAASSAEANVIRSYIETLLDMPWDNMSEDNNDIKNARRVLIRSTMDWIRLRREYLNFSRSDS